MGVARFFQDDAEEYLDSVVCSDRDKRLMAEKVARNATRLSSIMAEQYAQTEQRLKGDLDWAVAISAEGQDRVDEILEDLRNGEIKDHEAAEQLGQVRHELDTKVRPIVNGAADAEEATWAEVDCSPGEFERAVARRFPALFAGGRSLLELPTAD